jgi:hypothetical protein
MSTGAKKGNSQIFSAFADDGERWRTTGWRKGWDSNPRGSVNPLAIFKTAALNHSATLPGGPCMGEATREYKPFPAIGGTAIAGSVV